MAWPVSQDYNEAIQNPQSSFGDAELRGGEATTNALGMPMPRSGNFADVYEFNSPATNSKWAIKCFTRQVPGLSERYAEISASLSGAKLPFAVEFQYLEQGMRLRGEWYPILKMRWVEGMLLNELVRENLEKPAVLGQLGQIWARMAKRLRESSLAHADLQHGNVILIPGSKAGSLAVKLIDYDGMFVPALARKKSGEVGHPNYQHPQRLRDGTYSAEVDRFPLLVVATSLKALSIAGRELWDRYDNSDNLLFRESDLQAPGKSALFTELHKLPDPQMKMLAEALHKAAEGKLDAVPTLEDLLAEPTKPKTKVQLAPATPAPAAVKEPEVVEVEPISEAPVVAEEEAPAPKSKRKVEAEETSEDADDARPSKSKRKDAEPKRGVPTWAWAAGGAGVLAVGGIAAVVIAIIATMASRTDPKKDGSIVQHTDDGRKDVVKDKKIVTPIDPTKDKGPKLNPLPIDKKLASMTGGNWKIDGDQLVVATAADKSGMLVFGEDNWGDSDLTFEAKVLSSTDGGMVLFFGRKSQHYPCMGLGLSAGGGEEMYRLQSPDLVGSNPQFQRRLPQDSGRWYKIRVEGRALQNKYYVDDKHVRTYADSKPLTGGVGLGAPPGAVIAFKNVKVTDPAGKVLFEGFPSIPASVSQPPPPSSAGFVPLFNGTDLAGWKVVDGWKVEDGILKGLALPATAVADLYTVREDFSNFHLRAEVRTNGLARFRFRYGKDTTGLFTAVEKSTAGGLTIRHPENSNLVNHIYGAPIPVPEDQWINLEILAKGKSIEVFVNGTKTAYHDRGIDFRLAGAISLYRNGGSLFEVRKLEIKELKADTPRPDALVALKSQIDPVFIMELKEATGAAQLTTDGKYLVYSTRPGQVGFRAGPDFKNVQFTNFSNMVTNVEPIASFMDGKRMVLEGMTANKVHKIFVFDWEAKAIAAEFSSAQQVRRVAVSPDMKYLLAFVSDTKPNAERFICLFDVEGRKEVNRVLSDVPAHTIGFTPDSSVFFFGDGKVMSARSVKDNTPQNFAWDPDGFNHLFSTDFTRVSFGHQSAIKHRMLGSPKPADSIRLPKGISMQGRDFSADGQMMLISTAENQLNSGRAVLVSLKSGAVISVTEPFGGAPNRTQLAANGIGMVQGGFDCKPRLYQFPTQVPDEPVVPVATPGFTPLFDGKSLNGWKLSKEDSSYWKFKDGMIVGNGPNACVLYTLRNDFEDFHLRVESRINDGGKGAVAFRAPLAPGEPGSKNTGYFAAINCTAQGSPRTGSLFVVNTSGGGRHIQTKETEALPAGVWHTLEIIAKGTQIIVMVNGKIHQDLQLNDSAKGRIWLSGHNWSPAVVEFRKIEIKELSGKGVVLAKDKPKDPPVKGARTPVPDPEQVAQAEKTIRDQFKAEYAKKANADQIALAEKLLKLSKDTADNPTDCYTLLREARALSSKAGSVDVALKATADLVEKYDLDEAATKIETLAALSKGALNAEGTKRLVDAALTHASLAIADDHFEVAAKAIEAAEAALARNKNSVLLATVQKQEKLIKEYAKEHAEVRKAQEKLMTDAKDPTSNLMVGSYYAFRKGEWEKGMPMLALSGQADLQNLAKKELAPPADDKARIELAEAWWDSADKKPAHQKSAMQWRAAHWYREALPGMTGLARTRAADRVKLIDALPSPFRSAGDVGEVDRFKGHQGPVLALALSFDGRRVFSTGADGTLREWIIATGKPRVVLGPQFTKGPLMGFALTADEKMVAVHSTTGKFTVLELPGVTNPKFGKEQRNAAPGMVWFNNASIHYATNKDFIAWEPTRGSVSGGALILNNPGTLFGNVRAMIFAPDHDMFAGLFEGGMTVCSLMPSGGRGFRGTVPFESTTAAFSKDTKHIVGGNSTGNLRIYKVANMADPEVSWKGHTGAIRCAAYTPDGQKIVTGGDDKSLRVWDAATGKELGRFPHPGVVTSVVITPDNRYAITACMDSNIRVWNLMKAAGSAKAP